MEINHIFLYYIIYKIILLFNNIGFHCFWSVINTKCCTIILFIIILFIFLIIILVDYFLEAVLVSRGVSDVGFPIFADSDADVKIHADIRGCGYPGMRMRSSVTPLLVSTTSSGRVNIPEYDYSCSVSSFKNHISLNIVKNNMKTLKKSTQHSLVLYYVIGPFLAILLQ